MWREVIMLDYGLSNTAIGANWYLMIVELQSVAAFVVAAVLTWDRTRIWKRMEMIETQLRKIEKAFSIFEMQESRRLIMELNAKSSEKTDKSDTAVETGVCDIADLAISPATAAEQIEDRKSAKLAISRRLLSYRKPVTQR
jgi:hypothetical protein